MVIEFPNSCVGMDTEHNLPPVPWDYTNVIPFDPDRLTREQEEDNLYMLGL